MSRRHFLAVLSSLSIASVAAAQTKPDSSASTTAADTAANAAKLDPLLKRLGAMSVEAVAADPVHVRIDDRNRCGHREHGFYGVAALGQDRLAGARGGDVRRGDRRTGKDRCLHAATMQKASASSIVVRIDAARRLARQSR